MKSLRQFTRILFPKIPLFDSIALNKVLDVKLAIKLNYNLNFLEYSRNSYLFPFSTAIILGQNKLGNLMINKGNANPNFILLNEPTVDTFLIYSSPSTEFTNLIFPPFRGNFEGFKILTPTIISFLCGNEEMLESCFQKNGCLTHSWKYEEFSFLKFFLNHTSPTTKKMICMIKNFEILAKRREFKLTASEMKVFREEYKKVKYGDVTPCYEKRIVLERLREYGYGYQYEHFFHSINDLVFKPAPPHQSNDSNEQLLNSPESPSPDVYYHKTPFDFIDLKSNEDPNKGVILDDIFMNLFTKISSQSKYPKDYDDQKLGTEKKIGYKDEPKWKKAAVEFLQRGDTEMFKTVQSRRILSNNNRFNKIWCEDDEFNDNNVNQKKRVYRYSKKNAKDKTDLEKNNSLARHSMKYRKKSSSLRMTMKKIENNKKEEKEVIEGDRRRCYNDVFFTWTTDNSDCGNHEI